MANKFIQLGRVKNADIQTVGNPFKSETFLDISINSKKTLNFEGKECYAVNKNVDIDAIKGSLRNLFTWIPGERVLNPEFPTDIRKYIYSQSTLATKDEIVANIRSTIMRYEPRVTIDDIIYDNSVEDDEDHTVKIAIVWHTDFLDGRQYVTEIT